MGFPMGLEGTGSVPREREREGERGRERNRMARPLAPEGGAGTCTGDRKLPRPCWAGSLTGRERRTLPGLVAWHDLTCVCVRACVCRAVAG